MSALPPRLSEFRDQLGAAVDRDAKRVRRRRAVVSGGLTAAGVTAGVAIAVLAIPRGSEAPTALAPSGDISVFASPQEAKDSLPRWVLDDRRTQNLGVVAATSRLARVDGDRRFWLAKAPGQICLIDATRRAFPSGRRPGNAAGITCEPPKVLGQSMIGAGFDFSAQGLRQDVALVVPDGLDTVTFGAASVPVVRNVAVFRSAPRAEVFVAEGSAGERRLVSSLPPLDIAGSPTGGRPLGLSIVDQPPTIRRLPPKRLRHLAGLRYAGAFGAGGVWVRDNGPGYSIFVGNGGMYTSGRPTDRAPFSGSYGTVSSSFEPTVRMQYAGLVADGYTRMAINDISSPVKNNVALVEATVPKGRVTFTASGPGRQKSMDGWFADGWRRLSLTAPQPPQPVPVRPPVPGPAGVPRPAPGPAPAPPAPPANP